MCRVGLDPLRSFSKVILTSRWNSGVSAIAATAKNHPVSSTPLKGYAHQVMRTSKVLAL